MSEWISQIRELFTVFGLKVLAAIAIFIIGRWVAKLSQRIVRRIMRRNDSDPTLIGFISNLTYFAVLACIIIAALSQLGVQTASFVAVLGAAGLAIGLALQGSLSNFAAGVLMLIFRPFKAGDFIEGAGTIGIVQEIQIFTTILKSPDNRKIIVPNSKLLSDNIINYSAESQRRVDLTFGVSYDDNLDQVKQVITDVLTSDRRILTDPAPRIGVSELADSSVNIAVWSWVNAADYLDVMFGLNETIKKRFDAEGITIPYPHQDVYMHQVNN
ncbi:MAG TPA: mechanosensitive ion channel family protein [Elainellaceae cyanobacterium]